MRPRGLPGPSPGLQLSSEPDSRGSGWSLASLLRSPKPVQPPLQLADHAAHLPGFELSDVQLLLGLGGDGSTLADHDLVDLRLALQAPDLSLEVHDPSSDALGDVHSEGYCCLLRHQLRALPPCSPWGLAMPAVSFIPIAAGDEGVGVTGVPLGRPLCPLGGFPSALAAGTGGADVALAARRVLRVKVDLHQGGGVAFDEPSRGVHAGPSRQCLALDPPLRLLHSRGGCRGRTPLGLLVGAGGLLLTLLLEPSPLCLQGPLSLSLGLGLLLRDFCRAVSMASRFAAPAWALISASFGCPFPARACSNAFTFASFLAMASWAALASQATVASRAAASASCLSEADCDHSRGVHRHAVLPVGGLLLGDQDSSVHSSVVLRGPSSGNRKVAGHTVDALARVGHFASLRGGEDLGLTAAAACGGSWRVKTSPVGRLHVAAWA